MARCALFWNIEVRGTTYSIEDVEIVLESTPASNNLRDSSARTLASSLTPPQQNRLIEQCHSRVTQLGASGANICVDLVRMIDVQNKNNR